MRSHLFTYFLLFFFSITVSSLSGQSLPDFSSINISSLSDQQIESYLRQANAMGYSQADLLTLAKSQGLSSSELAILNDRIDNVESSRLAKTRSTPSSNRIRKAYTDTIKTLTAERLDIYGLDVFQKSSNLTFQTNQNTPTPKDYVLGAGDEVFIDVFGASESYYQTNINPDGTILLENIGPISLSGLTMEEAKNKVKSRLAGYYQGISGNSVNTFVSLSLGQVRGVSVNVIGQVEIPGTYNLSALNTVFNALYAAGGVNENGTLREIKHFRNGELLSTIDVYEFLQNGFSIGDKRIENGDVILVQPYTNRVTLKGATKIAGKFELKAEETVADLMKYSGGFAENAYIKSIKLYRINDGQRLVVDIHSDQFEVFRIKTGDEFMVSYALDRFTNRVIVKGAVFRPGDYSIGQGLTLQGLLNKAEGLKPDAFQDRILITRTGEDFTTESISISLKSATTFSLQKEDVVTVFSRNELREEAFVEVLGEVNSPGVFSFSKGLTLDDVLLQVGGTATSAYGGSVEISRRLSTEDNGGLGLSETYVFPIDMNGEIEGEGGFELEPYDQVLFRRSQNFRRQQLVTVEGQVSSPGLYAIKNQGERISDILNRAGGITEFAFVEGATLIRKTEFYEEPTDIEKQIDDLIRLQEKFENNPNLLTEAELAMISRIEDDIQELEKRRESNQSLSSFAKRERIKEVIERNALTSNIQLKQAEAIGIDLPSIINRPGSVSDLLLEEGDVLVIPKRSETVRLRGKLLYPTTSRFVEGKSLKYYINNAGGFDYRAKKKGTYVVYANGEVARTKSLLFMKFYPKPAPGAEVIVPTKPLKIPIRLQDVIGITSGLATLALVISQISQNN
ncbi:SLBB domain-containing protein [uncultured Roseivirga sp.]|uniref:polysaccharide biosynthesis/export family protein n=1 Tax=uncultured Roseivirga sp. TaxID=543088 RepID=UPI000D79ABD2|nr:SLBB domain-containing protein [uncultured Roseivirga sp.]PWL30940.1 MAG: capsule biosynthesis protein [Roseivirga sp. XM-24bin3]